MSSRYKVYDDQLPHFVTSTVIGWVDALTRDIYKNIICDSLLHCSEKKGLSLHAWVIMSNHVHLVISAREDSTISGIMRDFKKHTSKAIIDAIANNIQESRRDWMLNMFGYAGRNNNSNEHFQFWQQDYHLPARRSLRLRRTGSQSPDWRKQFTPARRSLRLRRIGSQSPDWRKCSILIVL